MKKILSVIGAAMLMVVGLVQASGLPTYLSGPDVPGGVVTVSAGANSVSVDAVLPEGYGVVGVYAVGGNSPSLSVNNRDTNSVSWVYSPAGAFSVPGVGTFNERALFNPPGLRDGLVTLTSATSWSFGSATNVVAVAIEGDPSGETTWVVGYVPPPTAVEVTRFDVTEHTSYVTNVTRKFVSGKLVLTTNVTVSVTTTYDVGIGVVTDDVVGFSIQEEWRSMFSGAYWTDRVAILYTPGLMTSGSFVPQSLRTGNYRLVAISSDGSTEVVATANSLGAPPPNTN
jgi:hypothetical protein